LKSAPSSCKFWNYILFWSHRVQREILIKNVFYIACFWAEEGVFLNIEISATKWQVLELYFILIASCSAWNSDQVYVCFIWFWAVEVRFSKYWNQRHLVASFGTKFYFDRIVFSVKFWSRMYSILHVSEQKKGFF
jgi:hypothetical protein